MNPRLRVALAAVPVISIGFLSWLPFLWLWLYRPGSPRGYGRCTLASLLGTACAVAMIVGGRDNEPMRMFGGAILLAHIAAATLITWVWSAKEAPVARDPYA